MLRWQATLTRVPKQEKKNSIRYSDDRWGERMKKKFKAKRTGLRSQRGLQNEGSSWEGGHQEIFMGCLRLRHTTGCRRESTNTLYPTPKYSLYKNAMTEGGLENPPPKSWPTNRIYRKFLLSDFFHPYITVSNFFSLFSPFDATKVNAKYSASAKLVKRLRFTKAMQPAVLSIGWFAALYFFFSLRFLPSQRHFSPIPQHRAYTRVPLTFFRPDFAYRCTGIIFERHARNNKNKINAEQQDSKRDDVKNVIRTKTEGWEPSRSTTKSSHRRSFLSTFFPTVSVKKIWHHANNVYSVTW